MKTLEALIDSIHDKGVRMKYTEQCHFRKAEKLAKSVGRFDLLLTALILTTTAYSYFSVAYKLPLWTSVLSGIAGTFGVILAFKREALSPSAQSRKHRNAADGILRLGNELKILRLRILGEKTELDRAYQEFRSIAEAYDDICSAAPDIDSDIYKEVQKEFLKNQEVTPEEIKVVFPDYERQKEVL